MHPPIDTPADADSLLRARFDDAERAAPADGEVDWFAGHLPRDAGATLDAMCGSGRLLVPLAAREFRMHGADASPSALAIAEARLAATGRAATFYRQDLPALNLPARFASAILDGSAFQRITDPAAARMALERLHAHLVEPGVLIVAAHVPDFANSRPAAPLVELRSVALPDGSQIRMRSETSIDADSRLARIDARYTHRRGARSLGEEHARRSLTWYSAEDFAALVSEAGWRDVRTERPDWASDDASFVVTARA